ncbi:LysR family transcriptional regulator [Mycolicibacterium sp. 018/SC-01/001]|uniref:LysR substrate-binding domain-containing protein n=1 Tax=Mycolicibacterium sp. 018/SC-01/001 TaxID=2592069 RepID=UPI00117C2B2F|nr:LysR substrate-binding domain-containing protein [Mycolicibacterium sp. 018/SC-01/001]TRW84932.1 LysR family transcriptional regulator [Mycolicibacterium sp. 018/SC-01/001]
MELRHLRYFRAVAEELHFGRAAERLHIAQPPLSQQIRALERELGVTLLTRSTRSVELTDAGRAYLARVIDILAAVDAAAEQARRIERGTEGRLAIGCVGSATYSLLPSLVRALRQSLPDIDVHVQGEMLAPAQVAALRSGEIDLGLLRPPVGDAEIAVETLRRDELLVALPADHPLAGRASLDLAECAGEDFISHAGGGRSRMGTELAALSAAAGFVPTIRHEADETSTLVTLVAAGLGVAIVPAPTAGLEVAGVCYRPMTDPAFIDLVAAYRRPGPTPMVARVLEVLKNIQA